MAKYVKIREREVPEGVRFDVPGRFQGQTVEVAFGDFGRGEHDDGSLYKRVHDRSVGPSAVDFYKLVTS
jgi:hypothetical protein